MKKIAVIAMVAVLMSVSQASQVSWGNDPEIFDWLGVEIPGSSTWIIRMYESVDASINFGVSGGVATNLLDDTWGGIEFSWIDGGLPGLGVAVINNSDTTYNLAQNDNCYSVLFNSSSFATASRFVIIDNSLAAANYVGGDFSYNPGGASAGDWQAVPEPATALLFGIGGMGAWMIRRNKLKSKEEADA